MLTGIHVLLTYGCTFECDHCFLYCSPSASGTFSIDQIKQVLGQAKDTGTIEWIYYEGGEPFLYYPLMVEGIRLAKKMRFKVGVVTNAYWANTEEDATLWLAPLAELRIDDLSISDDSFHQNDETNNTAKTAYAAALKFGLPVGSICIQAPRAQAADAVQGGKGKPIVGGDVRFRGRAVDKLAEGLPRTPHTSFTDCPYEELEKPERVHVDAYGYVQICQGICMGNLWQKPLSEMIDGYEARTHSICGPLLKGGPLELAREYGITPEDGYIDACHFCFRVRKALIEMFPEILAPRQVYGL
jgi:hypothetical protein